MFKPIKTSNYVANSQISSSEQLIDYVRDINKDVFNLFEFISRTPRFFTQNTEPVLSANEFCLWVDLDNGPKYYLVVNFNGVQKKVELT